MELGGASRDSPGFGAMDESLISSGGYTQSPDTTFGSKAVSGDMALTPGKQGRWESVSVVPGLAPS